MYPRYNVHTLIVMYGYPRYGVPPLWCTLVVVPIVELPLYNHVPTIVVL